MRSADRAVLRAYLASLQALDPTRYPRPEQLRPIWRDPRTHYALNCASIGCPNLAGRAYTRDHLERLLEEGARDYVNHPRGAAWQDGELRASSIYDWYQEDFGGTEAGVLGHLLRYARPELAERLRGYVGLMDYDYDWSLNEP